ncbi:MAG TPA: cbb3-type cytochrome c oxidase subunit I [Gammaproteobacteria bacterium]|nr:cbb3-type cytochrome c oxidase subunit I [Gammaproteobacteria bacterium]
MNTTPYKGMKPTQALRWKPEDLLGKLTLREFLFSNDYRIFALKSVLTSLVMLGLGGLFALTFRTELAMPDIQFFGARPYMGLMTLHGLFMVFGFVIPILISVCYYMLPNVIGTKRLLWAGAAQASYWTLVVAALALVIGRPDFTWTLYAPMSLRVGGDLVWLGYVAIALVGISEFLAGAVLLRNVLGWKGSWGKMPIMGWGMLTEAGLLLLSTPLLALVGLILLTDWLHLSAMFDPSRGGSARTFLWMFWFYGHPAVYLPLVPAIAILYTMLPRYLGRPLWSYWSAVVAFVLLFVLSFIVFHHHFQPDITEHTWVQRAFQFLTLLIFIPSTLHVFNWIATLWQDHIPKSARLALPFKFMMGAIFFLIVGGVTGYLNAQISVDSDFIHNTYWVPAHFHAMFLGFCAQMAVAGIYYLYPYFTGRMYRRGLGEMHFWTWQLGIFAKVMLMYGLGYAYFPRWVVDYLPLSQWSIPQFWLTVAGFLIGLGFLAFMLNLALSATRGEPAAEEPWPLSSEAGGAGAFDAAVQR